VALHVQRQVVRSGEGALTQVALEGLLSCVFPVVTSQLVGARELPRATFPRALVRLLSCNTQILINFFFFNKGQDKEILGEF
jgi:hypothetical protein